MFSLAGVPPTAGFYAKLAVLSAAVSAGYIWLAVAAVMFSLIGAFYYLRIVKLMYFDDPVDTAPVQRRLGLRRAAVGERPVAAPLRHPAAAADGGVPGRRARVVGREAG